MLTHSSSSSTPARLVFYPLKFCRDVCSLSFRVFLYQEGNLLFLRGELFLQMIKILLNDYCSVTRFCDALYVCILVHHLQNLRSITFCWLTALSVATFLLKSPKLR
ncbi:hypothetical protein M758_5G042900 [Ceratodon purpureus]|nr:hypothetical protein M758_5G042900 [Ceratodon purpureus]